MNPVWRGTGPQCSRLAQGWLASGVSCTCWREALAHLRGDCQGLIFASCVPFQRHGMPCPVLQRERVFPMEPASTGSRLCSTCLSRRPCWPLQKSWTSKKDEYKLIVLRRGSYDTSTHQVQVRPDKGTATLLGDGDQPTLRWLRPGGQRA